MALTTVKGAVLNRGVNVKDFGAVGDGTTDDTTAIQAAIATGRRIYWPDGTYLCDRLTITVDQYWDLGGAVLKRLTSAGTGNWLSVTATSFTIIGGTLDGNTANANGCHNIIFNSGCLETRLSNLESKNAVTSGGYGSGVVYNTGTGGTQQHYISECSLHDNDEHGLSVQDCTKLAARGNKAFSNGKSGISCNNFDTTFTQKILNCSLTDNQCYSNGANGILSGNFIQDNDISTSSRLYGHGNQEVVNMTIVGNSCWDNDGYGIAASGDSVNVSSNTVRSNGNTAVFGGMLFNARFSLCSNNIVVSNYSFGIDAGGCVTSEISGNFIGYNAVATGAAGVTIESCTDVLVSNNLFVGNSSTTGSNLKIWRTGGDGTGNFFPYITEQIRVKDNLFMVDSNRNGITVVDGVKNLIIANNTMKGAASNDKYLLVMANDAIVRDNYFPDNVTPTVTLNGSNAMVVPDGFESVFINTATQIEGINYTSNEFVGNDGVGWLESTATGSGYTSIPTVSFSGGGGTGAAADAVVYNGTVIGYRMTNFGSGYTSAPTVTISGGGGSGATATATLGVPLPEQRDLEIHFNQAVTVKRNGTVGPLLESPSLADQSVPTHGFMQLRGKFGRWQLASKNY